MNDVKLKGAEHTDGGDIPLRFITRHQDLYAGESGMLGWARRARKCSNTSGVFEGEGQCDFILPEQWQDCWGDLGPAGRIRRQQLTPPEARLVNQLLFEIGDLGRELAGHELASGAAYLCPSTGDETADRPARREF